MVVGMKKGATDKGVKRAENHNGEKKSRGDCIKGKRRNTQKRNESDQE